MRYDACMYMNHASSKIAIYWRDIFLLFYAGNTYFSLILFTIDINSFRLL